MVSNQNGFEWFVYLCMPLMIIPFCEECPQGIDRMYASPNARGIIMLMYANNAPAPNNAKCPKRPKSLKRAKSLGLPSQILGPIIETS